MSCSKIFDVWLIWLFTLFYYHDNNSMQKLLICCQKYPTFWKCIQLRIISLWSPNSHRSTEHFCMVLLYMDSAIGGRGSHWVGGGAIRPGAVMTSGPKRLNKQHQREGNCAIKCYCKSYVNKQTLHQPIQSTHCKFFPQKLA